MRAALRPRRHDDPLRLQRALEHRRRARVELLAHELAGELDDRDADAARAQPGRRLEAEQPAADDDRRVPGGVAASASASRQVRKTSTCGRPAPAIGGTNAREPVAMHERVVGMARCRTRR